MHALDSGPVKSVRVRHTESDVQEVGHPARIVINVLYGIGSVPSETLHLLMVQSTHDRIHELNEPVDGIFAIATTFSNVKVCLMLLKRQLLYSIRRFDSGHESLLQDNVSLGTSLGSTKGI